jgi:hypothetical protein
VEHEANDEDVIDGMGSADPESWEKAEEGVNSLDKILKKVNLSSQTIGVQHLVKKAGDQWT